MSNRTYTYFRVALILIMGLLGSMSALSKLLMRESWFRKFGVGAVSGVASGHVELFQTKISKGICWSFFPIVYALDKVSRCPTLMFTNATFTGANLAYSNETRCGRLEDAPGLPGMVLPSFVSVVMCGDDPASDPKSHSPGGCH